MNRFIFVFVALLFSIGQLFAQAPTVPSKMYFGDMELVINASARKKIQSHVDSYRRSQSYFQKKVDLANLYFPIIEEKFKSENVPTDFKYLIIQESGFVSDAVSSSNAVGFWQFKKASGEEVGLIINSKVDERKNISRSSLAAAKYLKRNNMYFSNWIYALQAYNQGAGGTQKDSDKGWYGKKKMTITGSTHWYVLKFLAHKIAYEKEVGGPSGMNLYLKEYPCKGESLKKIAQKNNIDFALMQDYNKWLNGTSVPTDRNYIVLLPIKGKGTSTTAPGTNSPQSPKTPKTPKDEGVTASVDVDLEKKEVKISSGNGFPDIRIRLNKKNEKQIEYLKGNPHVFAEMNGLKVIRANEGETKDNVALAGGIATDDFLRYNDIKSFDPIHAGHYYYLQSKRGKSKILYHTVEWNETMWQISQKYGVKLNSLYKLNRMDKLEPLNAGRVLYLRKRRKSDEPVKYVDPGPKPSEKKKNEYVEKEIPKVDPKIKKEVNQIVNEKPHDLPELNDEKPIKKEVVEDLEDAGLEGEIKIDSNKVDDQNTGKEESEEIDTLNEEEVAETNVEGAVDIEEREDVILHTVQQGETMYAISRKYKVTPEQIMKWNNMDTPALNIDQQIIVGVKEGSEGNTKEESIIKEETNLKKHVVQQGETLYAISRKYGVSVEQILEWNNKKEASVDIDEVLLIKQK